MEPTASEQDLGPADFFDAVSEEYRPLPAAPAVVLYLAVPILAIPALVLAAVIVPLVVAVRAARGQRVRGLASGLLNAAVAAVSRGSGQRLEGLAARPQEASRADGAPYSPAVAKSLSAARAGLRSSSAPTSANETDERFPHLRSQLL